MNRFLSLLLGMFCGLMLMASNPGGGGNAIPLDTCIAVSRSGECYSFIDGEQPQRMAHGLRAAQSPAKAPHEVGETTYNKLVYSIFDFDEGNGYVATLLGWVDSYDYYPDIVIPNTVPYNGKNVPVTAVNQRAFYGGWGINSVRIGENVNAIFDYAFYGCNLTELYIPISVRLIFAGAFMYNPLETVEFENPNQKTPPLNIGPFAFACLRIKNFEIPARLDPYSYIQTDRSNPFARNPYLSSISLNPATGSWGAPSRAGEADGGNCSFEIINGALCVASGSGVNRRVAIVAYPAGMPNETFELQENLIDVNEATFGETALKSIKLKATAPATQNDTKISIYGEAFVSNFQLEELSLEANGDVQLTPGMAAGCNNLESISLGSDVTNYTVIDDVIYQTIDDEMTLINYPGGKKNDIFQIPDGVKRISPQAMSHNVYIREVIMPHGLTHIGSMAFAGCNNLSTADFPATLQVISDGVFNGTQLENITIPASVTQIDENAFSSLRAALSHVIVLCETPPLSSSGEVANEIFDTKTLQSADLILPDNVDFTTFTSHPAWAFQNVQSAGIDDVASDFNSRFQIDGHTIISNSGQIIEVYNTDGSIVGSGIKVTVPSAGVYIVSHGSTSCKISLR